MAVAAADVPAATGLLTQEFELASRGEPFTSPDAGAWTRPGPKLGPFTVTLAVDTHPTGRSQSMG